MVAGRERSPGVVILLCIVTVGVYWFVWMYKAFDEVARQTNGPRRARAWVPAVAALYLAAWVLVVSTAVVAYGEVSHYVEDEAFGTDPELQQRFQEDLVAAMERQTGLLWSSALVGVAMYAAQIVYLLPEARRLHALAGQLTVASRPAPVLVVVFSGLRGVSAALARVS